MKSSHSERRAIMATGRDSVLTVDVWTTDTLLVPHALAVETVQLVPGAERDRFDWRDSILIRNDTAHPIDLQWKDGKDRGVLRELGPGKWLFARFIDQVPDVYGWYICAQGNAYWTP